LLAPLVIRIGQPNRHIALGVKHLARHVAGVFAGEEQEGGRDLIGLAGTAHRGLLSEVFELLLARAAAGIERRPDRSRRHRITRMPSPTRFSDKERVKAVMAPLAEL